MSNSTQSNVCPFDHLFSASIKIKKNKIKFLNFTDLITYQSWSPDNKFNKHRSVYQLSIQNWVDINFIKYNKSNTVNPYQPTTVMQIGYKNYIIVIKNAIYNEKSKYKLVFHISTKEINSKSKIKLPNGKFKHVRFDIDGFDRKIGNLINNLAPQKIFDNNYFRKEYNDYLNQRKHTYQPKHLEQTKTVTLPFVLLDSNFANLNFIPSGIQIWDQGKTGSCVAHSTGFLFTYIMGVGLNGNSQDAPLQDLVLSYNEIELERLFNEECNFSRSFIMWAACYTPIGNYNNVTTYSWQNPPSNSSGTQISNALVGLQTWGCVPINFDTYLLLPGKTVNNFNASINPKWALQQQNNFTIYSVLQNADSIIAFLQAGFPVTISMTIINYGVSGVGIGLVVENGLEDVLQWTDTSQAVFGTALTYHAVIAVGWTLVNNKYYVYIRNSWGTNFGSGGHFWMPMSFIVDNDSILGQPNCTALYTIALSNDANTVSIVEAGSVNT